MEPKKVTQINPLGHLSGDVSHALLLAGWQPHIKRRNSSEGENCPFQEFPSATLILDELYKLRVMPFCKGEYYLAKNIKFDPSIAQGYENDIVILSEWLNVQLYPLGMIGDGVGIFLLANTGHTLALAYEGIGVNWIGNTFNEGMLQILKGKRARPIYFENDIERRFLDPNDDLSDPFAYRPTKFGLQDETLDVNPINEISS